MTIEQLSLLYLNNHLINSSSYETTHRLIRNTFRPLAPILVKELSRKSVLEWHGSLRRTPYQANRALGVLKSMIRWGNTLDLYHAEPPSGIHRFHVSSRSRFLTTEELQRLITQLPLAAENIRLFILIVLTTGCRRSEARTIRWSDLDLTQRRWTKPKTKNKKWHVVPLPTQITRELNQITTRTGWLFPGQTEHPWSCAGIEKAWGKLRSSCNLQDVRIHDLRRTAASHLAINGENLSTIQKMLDHSSLQATAIYARLDVDTLDKALQRHADRLFPRGGLRPCS